MGLTLPLRASPEGCTLRFSRQALDAAFLANHRASSPDLSPLLQVWPESRRHPSADHPKAIVGSEACSLEVLPPSAHWPRGATSTGLASPGYAALSGFWNLSAHCSPRSRHGRVSCRWRSWGCALQSLPLTSSRGAFRRPLPSWRCLLVPAPLATASRALRGLPQSAVSRVFLCPPVRSGRPRCYSGTAAGALLGFSSPRVSHDPRWARLHAPSSPALQAPADATRKPRFPLCPVPQSVPPRVMWLVSCETAVLPGVPSLFTLHIFEERALPWLIVSPQGAVGVTATGPPICRPCSLRPG